MAFLTAAGGKRRVGPPLSLACCLAVLIAFGPAAEAHVGMRLRLGYRPDPALTALSRLTEIYLEASSGFSIDLKEFPDAASLGRAFREEKVDLAFEYPEEAWVRAAGSGWVAEFRPSGAGRAGSGPSCILSAGVAGDLAYYTLPTYLKKLIAALTRADLEEVLRRDPTGTDRDVLRDLLARKKLI